MTTLISRADRDLLNVDTIERAIAYAAFSLRLTNQNNFQSSDPFYDAVRIVVDKTSIVTSTLNIEAKLYYDQTNYLLTGGDLLESIVPFSTLNAAPLSLDLAPSTNVFYILPDEPSIVNTLEKYLLWTSHLFVSGLIQERLSTSAISVAPNREGNNYIVKITVSLPCSRLYNEDINVIDALTTSPISLFGGESNVQINTLQSVAFSGRSFSDTIFLLINYESSFTSTTNGASEFVIDNVPADLDYESDFISVVGGMSQFIIDNIPADVIDSSGTAVASGGSSVFDLQPADINSFSSGSVIISGSSTTP